MIVVKRTEAFVDWSGLAQRDVFADDVDDVVGFLDALFQGCAVFAQGDTPQLGPTLWMALAPCPSPGG